MNIYLKFYKALQMQLKIKCISLTKAISSQFELWVCDWHGLKSK